MEPSGGHPLVNGACLGRFEAGKLRFGEGRIDALLLVGGEVLRTASPASVGFGIAQVRRRLSSSLIDAVHVVFAPAPPRPLLLSIVRLNNRSDEPVRADYTELWEIRGEEYEVMIGACSLETDRGKRVLADVSMAVRASPPESPGRGLALDLRIVIPAHEQRTLHFAYIAAEAGEDPGLLVRAWRGEAPAELARTVEHFSRSSEAGEEPVSAYLRQAATLGA